MNISVFSAEGCSGCDVIKKLLSEKEVSFTVKDIMNSEVMEEAQTLGIRGIPVTVFYTESGEVKESIVGSSKQAIDRIFEIIG